MYPAIIEEKCVICKVCVEVCPYEVFEYTNNKIIIKYPEECIECGECIRNCEKEAIFLTE